MKEYIATKRKHLGLVFGAICLFALIIGLGAVVAKSTGNDTKGNDETSAPKVTGHKFVLPEADPISEPSVEEKDRLVQEGMKNTPKEGEAPPAKGKTRGNAIGTGNASTQGLLELFQYTNDGTPNPKTACGQAAMATLITHWRVRQPDYGNKVINEVWKYFPPDIAFGNAGTSWQQMERGLKGFGLKTGWASGEAELKKYIAAKYPVAMMLDVGRIPQYGFSGFGGHWVVAYAYDSQYVYLSNWGQNPRCTWADFRTAWNTWLTQANGTPNKALIAWK